MTFRHLDYAQDTPVSELGPAALADLLDRGDLQDWAPLARAIAQDPDGPLAQRVLALCEAQPMYGTSALWRGWIERLRSRKHRGAPRGRGLADLRRHRGLTQADVALRLGISQSDVSKLERRSDVRLSTIIRYVAATGGRLELAARYGDEHIRLDHGLKP